MGTPSAEDVPADAGAASISTFYSSRTWIEGAAVDQLRLVAGLAGVRAVAAFPDLHPGKYGPVGCAILSERIYPHLIGNDIGCGMSVFELDLPARKLRVDKMARRLRVLEAAWSGDPEKRLSEAQLPPDLHARSLGTIGGGNHFCEVQAVDAIFDPVAAGAAGITDNSVLLLVHSGSRALGVEVFADYGHLMHGLAADDPEARIYLQQHDAAVRWASLNRRLIAERAAEALRTECSLLADNAHNLIVPHEGVFLHRKGAARADRPLVPLAGSRDALSYLLRPERGVTGALASMAHGAGRKYDRRSMLGRVGTTRSERDRLERTSFGGQVVCEDRQLLIEEAPTAYKDSARVVEDLVHAGLAQTVAALKPILTYKRAVADKPKRTSVKRDRRSERRRER